MTSHLHIGWAEVDFTPDRKVRLAGQFAERVSEYVETPVTATAMAVEANGEQMVLCSCDLVDVDPHLQSRVRALLADRVPDLSANRVILCATHTHTAPLYESKEEEERASGSFLNVLERFLPEGVAYTPRVDAHAEVMSPEDVLEHLATRIASAVETAWQNRQPALFAPAFGRAAVGLCRRVVYSDGSARMWGDTDQAVFEELEAGNDSGLELLYAFDADRRLRGVVVNVACPAQCVQHRHFISSDYWGEVKALVRSALGDEVHILGVCGAAGDQCPVDMIRWVEPESPLNDPNISRDRTVARNADPSMFDLSGKRKAGARIAREIIDTYEEAVARATDEATFLHEVELLPLPVRCVTPTEYQQACRTLEDFTRHCKGSVDYTDCAHLHEAAGAMARYAYQRDHALHTVEIHWVRLGSIAIATNPFELFLNFGNQIKARSPAAQTFLIQLACGSSGYLPTRKAEQGGHYSAWVASGLVGHQGGELLVRATLEKLHALWRIGATQPSGSETEG